MPATKNHSKLDTYRNKRRASLTPEPFSTGLPPTGQRFVVQQHAARAAHYDLRLELGGVLVSWAVPKGPSPNPKDKRLAVHVEDHPLEYVNFEGLIPEGNYGAGAVIVWDRGRWVPLADPVEGLAQGKLLFELKGYKLKGKWTLVRTKQNWLFIKERDSQVREESTDSYPPDSILSGLTVAELAAGMSRGAQLAAQLAKELPRSRKVKLAALKPMLAKPGQPFSHEDWVYELKYDGYRLLACKEADGVQLRSRAGHDLTHLFPEVADVVGALPCERFALDGEVIVADEQGLPSFAQLQKRGQLRRRADIQRATVELPASFFAFDLLALEQHDLRSLPLLARKRYLAELLPSVGPIRMSEHIAVQGEAMFAQVERMGLEGVVAKRANSVYESGRRSDNWIKIAALRTDDFVVMGYAEPTAGGAGFGALLLGQYDGETLVFRGRVGTGFSAQVMQAIDVELRAAAALQPVPQVDPGPRGQWRATDLVVEVRYKELTRDGLLRQPVFLRLREDKLPAECTVLPDTLPDPAAVLEEEVGHPEPVLTNLDKIFWPESGYTKGDLIEYYARIAPWLLPYLKDRPVVLTRYPDGIHGKSFFQKDAPSYAPDWLRLETMWSEHAEREIRYFVIEDVQGLQYVANMASIPLHIWSSRVGALEQPDWCILDLDPKGAPFADVVRIARVLHRLCQDIELPNFVKTSGSTGLHVMIPLGSQYTYEQSRTLAELLARVVVQELPDIATVTRAVRNREGRVYVDYLQNGHGRLLVAPFSVRPLPAAPVSMPVTWGQVTSRLRMDRFTIKTAPTLMKRHDEDPLRDVMGVAPDLLAALTALGERLQG